MSELDLATIANLADDDPLRIQARNLIAAMLQEAEMLLRRGTPQIKATLIRSTVPQLVKALRDERKESEELVVMRAQLAQLQQAMIGITNAPTGPPVEGDTVGVVEDKPKGPARPIKEPPVLETPQSRRKSK